MLISLPSDLLKVNEPAPIHIWDTTGAVLLLRRGEVIDSSEVYAHLLARAPTVRQDDYKAWIYAYKAKLNGLLLKEKPIQEIADVKAPEEGRTVEVLANEPVWTQDPLEGWHELHTVLTGLLYKHSERPLFVERLLEVETRALQLVKKRPDDSLLVLIRMLLGRMADASRSSYSAAHALLSATLCELVAPAADLPEPVRQSLFRAALTMNIGMTELQDRLTHHQGPLSAAHKELIHIHPLEGGRLLRRLGVTDEYWLRLVKEHHETHVGGGYPLGKVVTNVAQQLLSSADVYVARISPRMGRGGLLPHVAARHMYLGPDGKPAPLGALFVKVLGIYPPGSFVQLANGEIAIVVRRGRRANSPLVYSIVGRQGLALAEPALRDTQDRAYEVKACVAADTIKVTLNLERLLARCEVMDRSRWP